MNTANCVRVFPSSALQFAAYGEIKRVAFNDDPTTAQRLVAGGSAGAIACFVTYPLDFIRGRLTTDMAGRYASVGGALADVVRNEGFFALYRGLLPSIIGIVPYVGVDFAVYDTLRSYLPKDQNGNPNVWGKLAAGAFAGMVGQTAAYPLDTVRRILQVQDIKVKPGYGDTYDGMIDAIVKLTRRDGFFSLYRGLFANYLKVIPAVSISFVVFEATKTELERTFGKR